MSSLVLAACGAEEIQHREETAALCNLAWISRPSEEGYGIELMVQMLGSLRENGLADPDQTWNEVADPVNRAIDIVENEVTGSPTNAQMEQIVAELDAAIEVCANNELVGLPAEE